MEEVAGGKPVSVVLLSTGYEVLKFHGGPVKGVWVDFGAWDSATVSHMVPEEPIVVIRPLAPVVDDFGSGGVVSGKLSWDRFSSTDCVGSIKVFEVDGVLTCVASLPGHEPRSHSLGRSQVVVEVEAGTPLILDTVDNGALDVAVRVDHRDTGKSDQKNFEKVGMHFEPIKRWCGLGGEFASDQGQPDGS